MSEENQSRNIYNGAREVADGLRSSVVLKLTAEEKAQKRELARQANQRMKDQDLQNVRSVITFVDQQTHAQRAQYLEERKSKGLVQIKSANQTRNLVSLQEDYTENTTLVGIGFGEVTEDVLTTFEQARAEAIKHKVPASYLEKVVDEQTGEVRNIAHIVYPNDKMKLV